MQNQRFKDHPKNKKKALASGRKIKTIAGWLVRELERKLPEQSAWRAELDMFRKVLSQTRQSKNKIYSLHEPEVSCIAKGKDHKKYEFGSKVSFAITKSTNVIVSVVSFKGNPYDGDTLKETLDFHQQITGIGPKKQRLTGVTVNEKWSMEPSFTLQVRQNQKIRRTGNNRHGYGSDEGRPSNNLWPHQAGSPNGKKLPEKICWG
jgi:hypothetical protein